MIDFSGCLKGLKWLFRLPEMYFNYIKKGLDKMSAISNQQNYTILDIVKGIGIIAVVIGHIPSILNEYFRPYLYHMPLFFLIGGILSKGIFNFSLIKKTIPRYYFYIIYLFYYFIYCIIYW